MKVLLLNPLLERPKTAVDLPRLVFSPPETPPIFLLGFNIGASFHPRTSGHLPG